MFKPFFRMRTSVRLEMRSTLILTATSLLVSATWADEAAGKSKIVLAHYMPWYSAQPFSDHWGWHWTMNHFDPDVQIDGKRQIASRHYPLIGPYDSGDPHVLEYHLLLMKLAGIDGVIVDWYGLSDFRDYPVLHRNTTRMLQQCERLQMKFVICYEDQTIPALVEEKRLMPEAKVSHALKEIEWLNKYWFQSPAYVRLDGQPVLLSFGHTGLTNAEWQQLLTGLSFPVMYFSQDFRREQARGGFGWPAPKVGLQQSSRFLTASAKWPDAIPAAFPRFQDIYREAQVGEGYPEIPDNNGQTFRETLAKAASSKARIVQLATWNDWGEGTQIEPSREFGYRDLEHLQGLWRQQASTEFAPSSRDLRIPLKILQLRRTDADNSVDLDRVVKLIADNELDKARQTLGKFEASPVQ